MCQQDMVCPVNSVELLQIHLWKPTFDLDDMFIYMLLCIVCVGMRIDGLWCHFYCMFIAQPTFSILVLDQIESF